MDVVFDYLQDLLSAFIRILHDKEVTEDMWAYGNTQIFLKYITNTHTQHMPGRQARSSSALVGQAVKMSA